MFNFKFARNSIKNNIRICLPFFLISLIFYILLFSTIALGDSTSLLKVEFGNNVWEIMRIPIFLLVFISSIAVSSAFSFTLTKRTDELKLYNLLGARYRDILILILKELVLLYLFIISFGTISGIAIGKFFYLIFINVIDVSYFNLEINLSIIFYSSLYYCLSFLFIMILSSRFIWKTIKSSHKHVKKKISNETRDFCIFIIICFLLIMAVFFNSAILKLGILILIIFVSFYFLQSYCLSKYIQLVRKKEKYYKKLNFLSINLILKQIKHNSLKLSFSALLLLLSSISMIIPFSGFYSESPIILNITPLSNTTQYETKYFNNLEEDRLDVSKKSYSGDLKNATSIAYYENQDYFISRDSRKKCSLSNNKLRTMDKVLTELGTISMIGLLTSISLSLLTGNIIFNSNVYLIKRKKENIFSFISLYLSTVDTIKWKRIQNILYFLIPIFLSTIGLMIILPLLLTTLQLLGIHNTKIIIKIVIFVSFINFSLYSLSFFFVKFINSLPSKEY